VTNTAKNGKGLIAKDNIAEFTEKGALEGLGKKIGKHGVGVAVTHGNVVLFQAIFDPKMPNMDVLVTFPIWKACQ
jgi:hypothetical protein